MSQWLDLYSLSVALHDPKERVQGDVPDVLVRVEEKPSQDVHRKDSQTRVGLKQSKQDTFTPRFDNIQMHETQLIRFFFAKYPALETHYLSLTKMSQTKCYKQSDTILQLSFHCSLRWCAPFCLLCCPLRLLLLIGGKVSTANQDPPIEWF